MDKTNIESKEEEEMDLDEIQEEPFASTKVRRCTKCRRMVYGHEGQTGQSKCLLSVLDDEELREDDRRIEKLREETRKSRRRKRERQASGKSEGRENKVPKVDEVKANTDDESSDEEISKLREEADKYKKKIEGKKKKEEKDKLVDFIKEQREKEKKDMESENHVNRRSQNINRNWSEPPCGEDRYRRDQRAYREYRDQEYRGQRESFRRDYREDRHCDDYYYRSNRRSREREHGHPDRMTERVIEKLIEAQKDDKIAPPPVWTSTLSFQAWKKSILVWDESYSNRSAAKKFQILTENLKKDTEHKGLKELIEQKIL